MRTCSACGTTAFNPHGGCSACLHVQFFSWTHWWPRWYETFVYEVGKDRHASCFGLWSVWLFLISEAWLKNDVGGWINRTAERRRLPWSLVFIATVLVISAPLGVFVLTRLSLDLLDSLLIPTSKEWRSATPNGKPKEATQPQ